MPAIKNIYLDYAASTPVIQDVIDEIIPYFKFIYGNPSNDINAMGTMASKAVEKATKQIKELLNAWNYNLLYTSGATESINTCLKSLYTQFGNEKNQIITCKSEHKAVLTVCEYLQNIGAEIIYLPIDSNGNISLKNLEQSITSHTLAVTLMAVNNETGVIHNIKKISQICHKKNVNFVCDATQAVGKLPLDLDDISPDYLAFSGHKIYAPKGIGILLFRKNEKISSLIQGGSQQKNLRAGTLNVPGIVGIGKTAEILSSKINTEYERITKLQLEFENQLLSTNKVTIVSKKAKRTPYISNVLFNFNDSEEFIFPLRDKLFFSKGSACTTRIIEPSHVLRNMGMNNSDAEKCLRFSFGLPTTNKDIETAVSLLKKIIG